MSLPAIHLDTNTLIYYTSSDSAEVIDRVDLCLREGRKIHLSAMSWAEFLCGPLDKNDIKLAYALIDDIIPITADISERAASLYSVTGRRSRSLPDCLIAATAIHDEGELLTSNHKDFIPFLKFGLQLVEK